MKTAYKLFRIKNGNLYPLYVFADEIVPVGEWVDAKEGAIHYENERPYTKGRGMQRLAYRPGWHCVDVAPLANHIGVRTNYGGILLQAKDTVWTKIQISDDKNYQKEADDAGRNEKGIINHREACLREIPKDGYYYFKPNPNAVLPWIICGSIKVLKILSYEEVIEICTSKGLEPQRLEL